MRALMRLVTTAFCVVLCAMVMRAASHATEEQNKGVEESFFPVSVWYSGGKARAPMLDPINADSPRLWKADLLKIKGLGFNTVRTWVEWNVG